MTAAADTVRRAITYSPWLAQDYIGREALTALARLEAVAETAEALCEGADEGRKRPWIAFVRASDLTALRAALDAAARSAA